MASRTSSKSCGGGPEVPSTEDLKREAAEAALGYVKSGMVLGLGTGSTARLFLNGVARLVADGMDLKGVPTSLATAEAAKDLGVPLTSLEERPSVDLAVDGADEVDPKLDLIKGLGGALFREKLAGQIDAIPGVVGHGLFLKMADLVLVGTGKRVRTLRRSAKPKRRS